MEEKKRQEVQQSLQQQGLGSAFLSALTAPTPPKPAPAAASAPTGPSPESRTRLFRVMIDIKQ